jgi:hypothetical protein
MGDSDSTPRDNLSDLRGVEDDVREGKWGNVLKRKDELHDKLLF